MQQQLNIRPRFGAYRYNGQIGTPFQHFHVFPAPPNVRLIGHHEGGSVPQTGAELRQFVIQNVQVRGGIRRRNVDDVNERQTSLDVFEKLDP